MNLPKIILFLPERGKSLENCYFEGVVEEKHDNIFVFYALDFSVNFSEGKCIAAIGHAPGTQNQNFVALKKTARNGFETNKIYVNETDLTLHFTYENDILLFFYNEQSFMGEYYMKEDSYFTSLQEKIRSKNYCNDTSRPSTLVIRRNLEKICKVGSKFEILTKYSSIASHIKCVTYKYLWLFEDRPRDSIKTMNLVLCLILDIILGACLLNLLLTVTSTEEFPKLFLQTAENFVKTLRSSLHWLTESPAGFKLNRELNLILTRFYLFHTEIWWLFLVFISPGLGVAFRVLTMLGWLGITFQAAIWSDILALVSFHAYCIYAYAAKLYNIQISGLRALGRLFMGRKWNPLREKVDSCHYSAGQLFVGTLLFTILLFLLPTVLIYYVVFTWLRLFFVATNGLLSRLRLYLHALPLYSIFLWCVSARSVCTQISVEADHDATTTNVAVLHVERVRDPMGKTLRDGIPDCTDPFLPLMPVGVIKKLLTGELLYPV